MHDGCAASPEPTVRGTMMDWCVFVRPPGRALVQYGVAGQRVGGGIGGQRGETARGRLVQRGGGWIVWCVRPCGVRCVGHVGVRSGYRAGAGYR